ncbi:MAG: PadR family transcriptional regulator [Candidatus ainarchaeum sp.]|nr:PadR family transcriptional regulator [Candidatus ainarchaeum sp.]MDD5096151.1 PadR family transcriptional regulator [Candidatus ainarchaeum sp.]
MFVLPRMHPKRPLGKFPGFAAMHKSAPAGRVMRRIGMLFVLWLIRRKPMKAYDAMKTMREDGMPFATANRIYPLFSSMEKEGLVKGKRISGDKRGGKQYFITIKGKDLLAFCREHMRSGLLGEYLRDMVK